MTESFIDANDESAEKPIDRLEVPEGAEFDPNWHYAWIKKAGELAGAAAVSQNVAIEGDDNGDQTN